MSTDAQIAANRANARHSTGPASPEGKAASSLNALKHGLFCKQVVLDCEDRAEFEAHSSALLADLAPAGGIEELLAQRAVCESWRLQRVLRIEREMMDGCMIEAEESDLAPGEPTLGQAVRGDFINCAFDRLRVYETRIERAFYKALGELQKRQALRLPKPSSSGGQEEPPRTAKPRRSQSIEDYLQPPIAAAKKELAFLRQSCEQIVLEREELEDPDLREFLLDKDDAKHVAVSLLRDRVASWWNTLDQIILPDAPDTDSAEDLAWPTADEVEESESDQQAAAQPNPAAPDSDGEELASILQEGSFALPQPLHHASAAHPQSE